MDEGHEVWLGFLEEQHAVAETLLSELTLKRNRIVAPHELEMGCSMQWMVDDEDDSPENAILRDWTVSHESAPISNRVDEERPEDSSTSLFDRVSFTASRRYANSSFSSCSVDLRYLLRGKDPDFR